MVNRCTVGLLLLLVCVSNVVVAQGDGVGGAQTAKQNDRGWTQLFDGKSLHGWYVLLPGRKRNEDPEKYFQVRDGVVHVYADQLGGSAVTNGVLVTDAEYSYYHFRM